MKAVDDMMNGIAEFLQREAKTETIIGQQFQLGEYTCVPVMSVALGFGGGGGEGKSDNKAAGGEGVGAGGGGGLGMGPVGFLVTRGDKIEFVSSKGNRGLSGAFEKIPDLVTKVMDYKKSEKQDKPEKTEKAD